MEAIKAIDTLIEEKEREVAALRAARKVLVDVCGGELPAVTVPKPDGKARRKPEATTPDKRAKEHGDIWSDPGTAGHCDLAGQENQSCGGEVHSRICDWDQGCAWVSRLCTVHGGSHRTARVYGEHVLKHKAEVRRGEKPRAKKKPTPPPVEDDKKEEERSSHGTRYVPGLGEIAFDGRDPARGSGASGTS